MLHTLLYWFCLFFVLPITKKQFKRIWNERIQAIHPNSCYAFKWKIDRERAYLCVCQCTWLLGMKLIVTIQSFKLIMRLFSANCQRLILAHNDTETYTNTHTNNLSFAVTRINSMEQHQHQHRQHQYYYAASSPFHLYHPPPEANDV